MGGYCRHGNVHFITVEAMLEAPTGRCLLRRRGVAVKVTWPFCNIPSPIWLSHYLSSTGSNAYATAKVFPGRIEIQGVGSARSHELQIPAI